MSRQVDVVIIGAGTAGLSAMEEVKKVTDQFLIVDPGPLGTTCARTGCMPSKSLLQVAKDFYRAKKWQAKGLLSHSSEIANSEAVMEHVRKLRDHFVGGASQSIEENHDHYLRGSAKFLDRQTVEVNKEKIQAKAFVVATGTSPVVPGEWKKYGDRILTTENLFNQKKLPKSVGVIGAGPVGIELGQALSRLGARVECFTETPNIGGLTDPEVQSEALRIFRKEFSLRVGPKVEVGEEGNQITVTTSETKCFVEAVLASMGRKPNLKTLGLEEIGFKLNDQGLPNFDPHTLQLEDAPIFLAGDVSGDRPVLHEASIEGRMSGYNATHPIQTFQRSTKLNITFTDPGIAVVGQSFQSLSGKVFDIGQASFENQGRSVMMNEAGGLLRVYAEKTTGLLLGAEMICPEAEHLAHLILLAIERKMTVRDYLKVPFYHPTVEEGLKTALKDLAKHDQQASPVDQVICDTCAYGSN